MADTTLRTRFANFYFQSEDTVLPQTYVLIDFLWMFCCYFSKYDTKNDNDDSEA